MYAAKTWLRTCVTTKVEQMKNAIHVVKYLTVEQLKSYTNQSVLPKNVLKV